MNAVLLSSDLMFSSRVEAAAKARGLRCTTTGTLAGLLEQLESPGVRLVMADLSTPGLDVGALVSAVRAKDAGTKIVAYAPHVHEQRLAAARDAGCDEVLTRGQFNGTVDALLARYLGDD